MNPKGNNTILITGGGSGIGRGLAEAFHKLGNKVIIAGRRKSVLEAVVAANPGMAYEILDVQDPAKLKGFATDITSKYQASCKWKTLLTPLILLLSTPPSRPISPRRCN
jgi:short-subunit dehydrogenase involved in D-alanine esterification of teichoic acids